MESKKYPLPRKLYKYQPAKPHCLENLSDRSIWFSKPTNFNDPFDCVINFDFKKTNAENWDTLFRQYKSLSGNEITQEFREIFLMDKTPNDEFKNNVATTLGFIFKEQLAIEFNNRGIACFSEKLDDILMWSHYADGHKGFCLEFDTSYSPFSIARPVEYIETFPPLNIADDRKEIMWDLVTTKSIGWSYEKEWRLFHEEGNKKYKLVATSLTGIYLGCAMSSENKSKVSEILHNSPTKIYESQISETEFKVEFLLIK